MDIKILRDINPWWDNDNWKDHDYHLNILKRSRYIYIPKWIDNISLEPFSLNFVIGPRQIGKTTGLKLLIKKLIENNKINNEKIVYIDCEIFPNFKYLEKYLLYFLEKDKERIFILDEVSSLNYWWKPIKLLIDSGKLNDSIVITTGSSSLKVKKDIELFPGRIGKGKIIEVLPLNFKEYIKLHGIKDYKKDYDKINELFNKYLDTGGFLSILNNLPSIEILKGFINEFIRFNKSEEIIREIFSSLIPKLPSSLSYRTIAKDTSGYSYKIVQNYIEFLKDLYIIDIAPLVEGKKILYRKERKIFFRDPLLLRLFSEWSNVKYLESALYENIVQEHLYRKYGEIYYYKNSYEVDCISNNLKVEVKEGKSHRNYPKDVIILDKENIPVFLINLF
ncbi:AAA+ superfamily ATPase [Nanobdella aerobiophila]|uniref:AAA+ superfamily ATPase n=1 Tax=Nanobdella aerobiophila TaxID=2586965 RepID=A0A915WS43_9ARCH|nr:ATP-binding protein [Nanobdella aerobiophila]BBL45521.1 AAA+ superfamily ATPase [Nanobdella aerobiophila]